MLTMIEALGILTIGIIIGYGIACFAMIQKDQKDRKDGQNAKDD